MAGATIKLASGGMWESEEWEICLDCEVSVYGGGEPCRHCVNEHEKVHRRTDNSEYGERVWTCPRVVVAKNESGHASTGVCLDCILDAAEALKTA